MTLHTPDVHENLELLAAQKVAEVGRLLGKGQGAGVDDVHCNE